MTSGDDTGKTTVVVVTWRGREHLAACLDALAAQTAGHRVLVVDNASDDGTAAIIAAHPSRPAVHRTRANLGYAGALARVLPGVATEYVAWLNDDAAPAPDWLAELEAVLDADPAVGAASARLETTGGDTQSVGVVLTPDGYGRDATGGEVFGFCGGAALLRTRAVALAGGVPAAFFCYYEDTDTSWRLRLAGWTVRSVPSARVRHLHGASTRPGSATFHRWNERNRLWMLLRCAPAGVAVRELARFAAITALLPVRRLAGRAVPDAWNYRLPLRLRVLAEVLGRVLSLVGERRAITRRATVPRAAVWRSANSAGQPPVT
ncbi:glycosyl transferase [Actinophytocola xinjiangensis]|uniref:Glycosyl transferase n=1 Tax=Actinophytocola xinjiangensis TaxID=485602 RepID=A0A7Z1AUX0_9PSEU|nr:glycosyltransferase [Actinophytocola xinjiangensis]OLF04665.1 glycosyl transferase [Actinophytocola xinjiangensis]